jgi:NADH-quinone oxidoreductase subunit F
MRVASIDDLRSIQETCRAQIKQQETDVHKRILVCTGGGCIASGALKIKTAIESALLARGLQDQVSVVGTGCMGPCAGGPIVVTAPDRVFYQHVALTDVDEIIDQHIRQGIVVERLAWQESPHEKPVVLQQDLAFFKRQTKIVLRNCGRIDPLRIDAYIAEDGYAALAKAITTMTPEDVIAQMKKSGLRGRGGAGFPTAMKWGFARASVGDTKYILCNADEGDPGAFMDRSVLEGDPHSVIEGMAIGAYAIGARQGYVYVRAEYPLAVERLQLAMNQAREHGLLGANILGTSFCFDLEIRMGSGAFVCGEETALINSIEGKRGEPRPRPPFPAQKGLWNKPSCLNNVETFANVPAIILKGGDWFASYGVLRSKGTKVFALAGAIKHAGLVEIPVGTPLGELIYDIGGGIVNDHEFKAAQIGGPSGGCVPRQHLNVPLDYESLTELGAIMGSGGLIVMDSNTCMVDVARFFLEFVQEESCGKCVPCREGTKRMLEILNRITRGQGQMEDIDLLITLGEQIKDTSLCGLGQTAPNPVLSTIRHFRHEYEAHILLKQCDAGVCPNLVRSPCSSACPASVNVPGFISLVGEKRYNEALRLHRERNPLASICARVCVHPCETKCRRCSLDEPVSVRGIKRFMVEQEDEIQIPEVKVNAVNAAKKIAIIGAGPAGLSCAFFLARLGYKPVIFEAANRPGGMLVQTIPSYRLPRERMNQEIEMIRSLGVTIKTNTALGRDFTLSELKAQGYEAIFLGLGAPQGSRPSIPGSDAVGVTDAMDFLRDYNMNGHVPAGKNVVVVGGGNAAIDAVRTAIRLGAKVTIVYRRTREEMPAHEQEIADALAEGAKLLTLTNPEEIVVADGQVRGVKCAIMKLGAFDSSGRRAPEKSGQTTTIDADQVIFAIGQKLDSKALLADVALETGKGGWISSSIVTGQTALPWLFSGGDCATGPWSVIGAVAAGERAAFGIDCYLSGEGHAFWRANRDPGTTIDPDAPLHLEHRQAIPTIAMAERISSFAEVETIWTEDEAISQCRRCLRCDVGKY